MTKKPKPRFFIRTAIEWLPVMVAVIATGLFAILTRVYMTHDLPISGWLIASYTSVVAMCLITTIRNRKFSATLRTSVISVFAVIAFLSGAAFAHGYQASIARTKPAVGTTKETAASANRLGTTLPTSQQAVDTPTSQMQSSTDCRQVDIPYGVVEQPAIWLYTGQSEVANRGIIGKKRICTDSLGRRTETIVSKPFDEVRNVGTKPYSTPPQNNTPQYTYDEAYSEARAYCDPIYAANGAYDSTQRGDCIAREMKKYGY